MTPSPMPVSDITHIISTFHIELFIVPCPGNYNIYNLLNQLGPEHTVCIPVLSSKSLYPQMSTPAHSHCQLVVHFGTEQLYQFFMNKCKVGFSRRTYWAQQGLQHEMYPEYTGPALTPSIIQSIISDILALEDAGPEKFKGYVIDLGFAAGLSTLVACMHTGFQYSCVLYKEQVAHFNHIKQLLARYVPNNVWIDPIPHSPLL